SLGRHCIFRHERAPGCSKTRIVATFRPAGSRRPGGLGTIRGSLMSMGCNEMNACLRTLFALCLAGLMVACTHTATSTLGELPRTPKASIEQQLQQADQAEPEEANLLRLSAADQALKQNDPVRARRILQLIQIDSLKPAQQI